MKKMKKFELLNMKRIIGGVIALKGLLLLTGCSYHYSFSTSNNNANNQQIPPTITPDEQIEIPEFKTFTVTKGGEDVTSTIDQKAMEKFVYYVYSANNFTSSGLDTMATLNDPANAPDGCFALYAEYDTPVKVNGLEVTEVYIIPDFRAEYLFEASGVTIALTHLEEDTFIKICKTE